MYNILSLDSEDDYRTGCRNVSDCQQQSYSEKSCKVAIIEKNIQRAMDDGKSEETSYPPYHRPPALSFFLSPASPRHKQASSEERGFVPEVWQCASFSSVKVVAVRVARQTRGRGWMVTLETT